MEKDVNFLIENYGEEKFNDLVEEGQLKKKDKEESDSSTQEEVTVSTTVGTTDGKDVSSDSSLDETNPAPDVGPTGVAGVTGFAGITGPTGPQGVTGPQGMPGPQGITGPIGATGVERLQGPAGMKDPKYSGPDILGGDSGLGVEGVQGTIYNSPDYIKSKEIAAKKQPVLFKPNKNVAIDYRTVTEVPTNINGEPIKTSVKDLLNPITLQSELNYLAVNGDNGNGISKNRATQIIDNRVTEFGDVIMQSEGGASAFAAVGGYEYTKEMSKEKSDLFKKVKSIEDKIENAEEEMTSLLTFKTGGETYKLNPDDLVGEDRKRYNELKDLIGTPEVQVVDGKVVRSLTSQLNKAKNEYLRVIDKQFQTTDDQGNDVSTNSLYNIYTGEFQNPQLNPPTPEMIVREENINDKALAYATTNDVDALTKLRNETYYRLLHAAKDVKLNIGDVAAGRSMASKFGQWTGIDKSIMDKINENFPNPEDSYFKNFNAAFLLKSSNPKAMYYNDLLNEFDILNRALVLNRDPGTAVYSSPLDLLYGTPTVEDITNPDASFVEGFSEMFVHGGVNKTQKGRDVKPFYNALSNNGFTGQEIANLKERAETTIGEDVMGIGGNLTAMYIQMGGPQGVLNAAKVPALINAGRAAVTVKNGKWVSGIYPLIYDVGTLGTVEAAKFYATGKIFGNEEYYDPKLGFMFGALTPVGQLGGKLFSKVPGVKALDDVLKNKTTMRQYEKVTKIPKVAIGAGGGVSIAYAAEIMDDWIIKGNELGEAWDKVIYGKDANNPEGVNPIRKAGSLWAAFAASQLFKKPENKIFWDELTTDLSNQPMREVNIQLVENVGRKKLGLGPKEPPKTDKPGEVTVKTTEQYVKDAYQQQKIIEAGQKEIMENGTPQQKEELKIINQNIEFNKDLGGIQAAIADFKAEEQKAKNKNEALVNIVTNVKNNPSTATTDPSAIQLPASSTEAIITTNKADNSAITAIVDKAVTENNISSQQGTSIINKITQIKSTASEVGVTNTKRKSRIVDVLSEVETIQTEIEAINKNKINSAENKAKVNVLNERVKELNSEVDKLAETPESNSEFWMDLISNPNRQDATILNPKWAVENPQLWADYKNLVEVPPLGKGLNKNQAFVELAKQNKAKDDAIQESSAEEISTQEPPGDSPKMGESVPETIEVTEEVKEETVQTESPETKKEEKVEVVEETDLKEEMMPEGIDKTQLAKERAEAKDKVEASGPVELPPKEYTDNFKSSKKNKLNITSSTSETTFEVSKYEKGKRIGPQDIGDVKVGDVVVDGLGQTKVVTQVVDNPNIPGLKELWVGLRENSTAPNNGGTDKINATQNISTAIFKGKDTFQEVEAEPKARTPQSPMNQEITIRELDSIKKSLLKKKGFGPDSFTYEQINELSKALKDPNYEIELESFELSQALNEMADNGVTLNEIKDIIQRESVEGLETNSEVESYFISIGAGAKLSQGVAPRLSGIKPKQTTKEKPKTEPKAISPELDKAIVENLEKELKIENESEFRSEAVVKDLESKIAGYKPQSPKPISKSTPPKRSKPKRAPKPVKLNTKKADAVDLYNDLNNKGVKPSTIFKELNSKFTPKVVESVLKNETISTTTLRNQVELQQKAKDLLADSRVAKEALTLNKKTVKEIADKLLEIEKEVKKYLPGFTIKGSEARAIMKKPAVVDLTPNKAEKLVEEISEVLDNTGKKELVKYIETTIKEVKKPKKRADGKPKVEISPEAQVEIYEAASMLEGVDLNSMSFDQLKIVSESLSNIKSKGKTDKALMDRAKRIGKTKREGSIAEGLYGEGPVKAKGVELEGQQRVKDYLSEGKAGNRLVIIEGNLITSPSSLATFIKDNPLTPINGTGYETLTLTRAKRVNPPPKKYSIKKVFDPTKAIANVVTQLKRVGKGSSELKKTTNSLIEEITEDNPAKVLELTNELNIEYKKALTSEFDGSVKKAMKFLDTQVKGLFKTAGQAENKKDKQTPMSNGNVVDLIIEKRIHDERADVLDQQAAKETNLTKKKALKKKAKDMRDVLQNSDINVSAFNDYVKKNPKLEKISDSFIEFYRNNTKRFEPLITEQTGRPPLIKTYYPTYRADVAIEGKSLDQKTIEELTNPSSDFYNASAMTDRLKMKDETLATPIAVELRSDVRVKAQDYIHNMVHAEVYIPTSKKVNELFNPSARGKIYEKVGAVNFKNLQDNLDNIIDPKRNNPIDEALDWVSKANRIGISLQLGFALQNIPKQMTSFTHYGFVGGKDGITVFDWIKPMMEIPFNSEYKKIAKEILTSPYVRDRIRKSNIDPDLKIEYENALKSKGDKLVEYYQKIAMSPITFGDIGGVLAGGIPFAVAKYKKVKTTPKGEYDTKAYKEAYKRFQAESSLAQQSGAEFTLSKAQRNKFLRIAVLPYKTAQIQAFNKSMQGWIDMTDKSNESRDRWDGFKRWAYFSTSSALFQFVSAGGLYMAVDALLGGDELDKDEKDKDWDQILYDSVTGAFEGYVQGMGAVGYLPQIIINTVKGRPPEWNLPFVVSKGMQAGKLIKDAAQLILTDKDWDDLSQVEKDNFFKLFNNLSKLTKASAKGDAQPFIDKLLSRGKNYGDPSFETLVNDEDFELKEYITIPKPKKKKEETKKINPYYLRNKKPQSKKKTGYNKQSRKKRSVY